MQKCSDRKRKGESCDLLNVAAELCGRVLGLGWSTVRFFWLSFGVSLLNDDVRNETNEDKHLHTGTRKGRAWLEDKPG